MIVLALVQWFLCSTCCILDVALGTRRAKWNNMGWPRISGLGEASVQGTWMQPVHGDLDYAASISLVGFCLPHPKSVRNTRRTVLSL